MSINSDFPEICRFWDYFLPNIFVGIGENILAVLAGRNIKTIFQSHFFEFRHESRELACSAIGMQGFVHAQQARGTQALRPDSA